MPLPKRCQPYLEAMTSAIADVAMVPPSDGFDVPLGFAIMDRESRKRHHGDLEAGTCGDALDPEGPTGTGDNGNGLGLMQLDKNQHPALAAATMPDGSPAWQDPAWNIAQGITILHDALVLFDGDVLAAIAHYNAGEHSVRRALAAVGPYGSDEQKVAALDSVTTDGDYVSWVLERAAAFRA